MLRAVVGAVVLALAASAAPWASGDATRAAGTLNLVGRVPFVSTPTTCPAGFPEVVVCHARTGTGLIAGLGHVTENYLFSADPRPCPTAGTATILPYDARLSVEGKGDIILSVAGIPLCMQGSRIPGASPQAFTVTGGVGIYAGASGGGTLTRIAGSSGPQPTGADTWTGTVVASGVDFDIAPPTITGARPLAVRAPRRAKSTRVTYALSASDETDGPVPVACLPPSGSRFKIGRTRVTCSATDRSANTATASFTVTVVRRR